jgi:hypothetical protein
MLPKEALFLFAQLKWHSILKNAILANQRVWKAADVEKEGIYQADHGRAPSDACRQPQS